MSLFRKRIRKVYMTLGFVFIMELGILFYNSGTVVGMNIRADKLKAYAIASRDDNTVSPGNFYDRNGIILTENVMLTEIRHDKEGKQVEKTVRKTQYRDGKAYSQLLGYTGGRIIDMSVESVEKVVGRRDDYRLMAFMDSNYWGDNGLYTTTGANGDKGQDVTLTIDHKLQMEVYESLARQMDESAARGSAVVMNAKTGEILSMVAFPTYDFNDLGKAKEEMQSVEEETELEPGFPVTYKGAVAPGSIFKVFTAVALIDHGLEGFTVVDEPFIVNEWQCNNAYSSVGDEITYYEGMERSSNVFYAQAALKLGADKLRETAEKFMLFEEKDGDNCLSTDFGLIQYNWDLDVQEEELAQTGFGQGKTELSTVYAAAITQAIANDGVMMTPYLVKKLTDADGKVVYTGKAEMLSKSTSASTANKVTEAMRASARYSSTCYKGLGDMAEVFQRYKIAGKTGTAETGDENDSNNAWFISFAPADEPQYVVAINQCKTDKGGYRLMNTAAEIYEYLFERGNR
ncbi:penicillin-binding protein A [Lachnospiraceae bacterium]|nr:penicillin-binding protein A [Lachnospiraceae bacterium]